MRRPILIVAGIVSIMLLTAAIAIPVAAHVGTHRSGPARDQATATSTTAATAGQATADTLTLAQAKQNFSQYLQNLGYDNLNVSEVMQFSNQFYAEAVETKTGAGAFEMVMNLNGQSITPEPGPTMMWNTRYSPMFRDQGTDFRNGIPGSGYGMMGGSYGYGMMTGGYGYGGESGMMGGYVDSANGTPTDYGSPMGYHPETATTLDQPLTAETAQEGVQSWLDQNRPGVTATDATAFPGYFTFHTEQNGKITGMLSIQSSTGAIWEHVWHGTFVDMQPAP